jgi:ectoine hydroxylase-related dioxygenase (phytanoyl-CoA dioxygenase family)
MNARISSLDFGELDRAGYLVLPCLVRRDELEQFERHLAAAGDALSRRRGLTPASPEPIADVLQAAGRHRALLFDHLKHLHVLTRLASDVAQALEDAGLFRHSGVQVPIVWSTLRADLPGERTYMFPLHQDYATTRCATAWRLWVPLRDVDRHHGTMAVAAASHHGGPYRYVTDNTDYPHIAAEELAARDYPLTELVLPAGDSVLFNPHLVHASVPNLSRRTKWVWLLHLQDLATFVNPDDPRDPLCAFLQLTETLRAAQRRGGH